MSYNAALPPWLLKAVEEAGDATVILKAGDRPYVIRSKAPYHLGTQPLTNLALEALAQQILSEDAQQALYDGQNVQETLPGERAPVVVRAVRMDHDIVIRLRQAQEAAEAPAPPESPAGNESVTVLLQRQTLALNEGLPVPAATPTAISVSQSPAKVDPPPVEAAPARPAFVIQNAGGEVVVETAGGEVISDIELPTSAEGVDTYISALGASQATAEPAGTAEVGEDIEVCVEPGGAEDSSTPEAISAEVEPVTNLANLLKSARQAFARSEPEYAEHVPTPGNVRERRDEYVAEELHEHVAHEPEQSVGTASQAIPTRREPISVATATMSEWITEAMDRGATALYLRTGYVPAARIDGQIETLAPEALPISMFEQAGATLTTGEDGWRPAGELSWSKEIPGAGTVRCQAFSDDQGGGLIIQLPVFVPGLDQHVPRHIRTACEAGEGVIVISAPFAEDVAAMVGAVVASNAKRRAGFVVAFGFDAGLQTAAGEAFVSGRPLPSSRDEMITALQGALTERPDTVVVLADGNVPAAEALASAATGRLVIIGVVARTAPRAVEALLENRSGDRRVVAAAFRAACSWRGFRRAGGQRVVVSDVLVGSESVKAHIEAADIIALHMAQATEQDGLRALDAALAGAVTRRKITLREAAACAVDRKVLVALVRRQAWKRRDANGEEHRAADRVTTLSVSGV